MKAKSDTSITAMSVVKIAMPMIHGQAPRV